METQIELEILPQPDDTTCGPTCLHAIYRFYGEDIELADVIREVPALDDGGTLAVLLGTHALSRGYDAHIYTYNLQIFDPTWFSPQAPDIRETLRARVKHKSSPRMAHACEAYITFLGLGGHLHFEDLTTGLIRKYLNRGIPILTGLSATYLYRSMREYGPRMIPDSVRGDPQGHFVVLCGYDKEEREVAVADPMQSNPIANSCRYVIGIDRVLCAILLGIITHDANLLIIEPRKESKAARHADHHRR